MSQLVLHILNQYSHKEHSTLSPLDAVTKLVLLTIASALPYLVAGSNIEALNQQTEEVKGIVRQNINKVVDRGEKLDDLGDKAEFIRNEAVTFEKRATRVRRKQQCQHCKLYCILILIISVIIFVILIAIVAAICGTGNCQ